MSFNQEFPCTYCKVLVTWKYDETRSKNRPWEKSDWHNCEGIKTIVNPKALKWFCWECGIEIDIANHPCLHYQKLNTNDRAMVRFKASSTK